MVYRSIRGVVFNPRCRGRPADPLWTFHIGLRGLRIDQNTTMGLTAGTCAGGKFLGIIAGFSCNDAGGGYTGLISHSRMTD